MQAAQAQSLSPTLRTGTIEDAEECGRIMFEAFRTIGPPDFPSVEVATLAARMLLSHPGFYSVVAELGGRVAGSNFLDERSPIAGVGPITVDPPAMNRSIGRQLMVAVMDRAEQLRVPGVRLVQTAYHYRSLALYTKLGFDTRETLSVLQLRPLALQIPGHEVRLATREDLPACNELCRRIHGVDRGGELLDAIGQATAHVVERRKQGHHVGEMAVINSSSPKSASVIAAERSIVAKVLEQDFLRLANAHPQLWRFLAVELCHRLIERRKFHREPNLTPVLF